MSSDPGKKPSSLPIARRPAPRPPFCHPSFGLPAFRQNTTPFAASPLQSAMSAASNGSDSGSPPREDQAETATRSSRSMLQVRPRAHSRSSSAPTSLSVPRQSSAESSSRATSPTSPGNQENRRSVKHLTCFWWKEKGSCRHSDEDCLYAHYDTGRYTDPPRQLVPGEPAKAGKNLERSVKSLVITSNMNKPSSSFESLPGSGASTPGLEMPLIRVSPSASSSHADRFSSVIDAAWLRNMLDQANREKAVFLTNIQNLQEDIAELQTKIDNMQAEKDQLTQERDLLRSAVNQLQHQPARATANPNPYGVIGGSRNLGARASWTGPATSTSRASSHSDPEEGEYDGPIRGSGPRF